MIAAAERARLLALARRAAEDQLLNRSTAPPSPLPSSFLEPRGAFVSLHTHDRLRGCIGRVDATAPLWQTVVDMARAAAFSDPRFPPIDAAELKAARIEISILTPPRLVARHEDIVVGTHGLIVETKNRRGLLLPQVPQQYGWDRDTFIEQTCIKAGLSAGEWRDGHVDLLMFCAEVFAEGSEESGS